MYAVTHIRSAVDVLVQLSPGAKRSIKQSERGAVAGALAAAAGWIYYHKAAVTQPFISIITTAPHTASPAS